MSPRPYRRCYSRRCQFADAHAPRYPLLHFALVVNLAGSLKNEFVALLTEVQNHSTFWAAKQTTTSLSTSRNFPTNAEGLPGTASAMMVRATLFAISAASLCLNSRTQTPTASFGKHDKNQNPARHDTTTDAHTWSQHPGCECLPTSSSPQWGPPPRNQTPREGRP